MKPGFVPALGTPLDKDGNVIAESLKKHINDQIDAGAVGLLCMGSMGIEAFIRDDVYPEVAKIAVEATAGRVPLFIGAMDTSIARVKQRIAPLEDMDIDGLVFMAPFYSATNRTQMMNFFRGVAALTKHKILIYDLPVVCQAKITYDMVLELIETVPNFAGIKSADTVMFRKLKLNPSVPKDFIMVYSGLDMFDATQIPLNVFDWGQIENGGMEALARSEKTVFVRSVFLQGLVFHTPEDLDPRMSFCAPYLEKYLSLCKEFDLAPDTLALSYVLSVPGVSCAVLGCDNISQLEANCKLIDRTVELTEEQLGKLHDSFANIDARVINPGTWFNHT